MRILRICSRSVSFSVHLFVKDSVVVIIGIIRPHSFFYGFRTIQGSGSTIILLRTFAKKIIFELVFMRWNITFCKFIATCAGSMIVAAIGTCSNVIWISSYCCWFEGKDEALPANGNFLLHIFYIFALANSSLIAKINLNALQKIA